MNLQTVYENNREILAEKFAHFVVNELQKAINIKKKASIAVAGGSTPCDFLKRLGHLPLDWQKVVVTLTDERCVSYKSDRSNAQMISNTLLKGKACKARFIPFYNEKLNLQENIKELAKEIEEHVMPIDICVLGMGNDMHAASLFPGAKRLSEALDSDCRHSVLSINPLINEEPRITMTANSLRKAQQLHLLIYGEEKLKSLEKANSINSFHEAPINVALQSKNFHTVWYAP